MSNIKRYGSVCLRNHYSDVREKNSAINKDNRQSIITLDDFIKCGICKRELQNPKMLNCQHTFCLICIQSLMMGGILSQGPVNTINNVKCPTCHEVTPLKDGINSIENLRGNLYLESLLKAARDQPQNLDSNCVKCNIKSNDCKVCQHCLQVFCNICWDEHMPELNEILSNLTKRLDENVYKIDQKSDYFKDHCEQIRDLIDMLMEEKMKNLKKLQKQVMGELEIFKDESDEYGKDLKNKMEELKNKMSDESKNIGNNKDKMFRSFHEQTSALINKIHNYGENKIIFDSEKCKLDLCKEGIYNDDSSKVKIVHSIDPRVNYYKTRPFVAKLKWSKCPRSGGVGIAPWDTSKLYIAATDNSCVLKLDMVTNKLLGSIRHDDMAYACAVAFSMKNNEIFISDKWNNCVHVFSRDEAFQRTICKEVIKTPNGIAIGPNNELVISDSGNKRILIVSFKDGEIIREIRSLNNPTALTIHDSKIYVADTGNHRIKIFNFQGESLQDFGTLGKHPGQFRYAEAIAVDRHGFILVGDAGNARIQVFKPDGTIVRIFGCKEGFGWVSGLAISDESDIILTDHKNRSFIIF
ncbi:unnamed protein product [Brassicogethes aeneus]|uniref:RING-type domain-containing protein n=1 Tax=Brassicogethes aeneus TaxID=1431903 RepID=A0A9P0FEC3_BRAAE|nr:unnamed protein product [Brassicogethes aeneus]